MWSAVCVVIALWVLWFAGVIVVGLSYLFLLYFGDCYVSLVVCVLVLRCVDYVLLDLLTVVYVAVYCVLVVGWLFCVALMFVRVVGVGSGLLALVGLIEGLLLWVGFWHVYLVVCYLICGYCGVCVLLLIVLIWS